jgi:hypothetical protein
LANFDNSLRKEINVRRSFSQASLEPMPMFQPSTRAGGFEGHGTRGDQIRENSLADGNFLAAS